MGGTTFFHWSGGLGFPSPQTHPSPSHTSFCPIKWHSALATPSEASQMGRAKCTWEPGFEGNTPCGRNLPAHSPPQWHVLRWENQQHVPVHIHGLQSPQQTPASLVEIKKSYTFTAMTVWNEKTFNLLVSFASDWSQYRSPQRPFHRAADLRKKNVRRSLKSTYSTFKLFKTPHTNNTNNFLAVKTTHYVFEIRG